MGGLGMRVLDPVLRVQYQPAEKDLEECKRLGKDIAVKVKKITEKHGKSTSGSKLEDAGVQEVKMGDGGH
jgi:flavodoxin I